MARLKPLAILLALCCLSCRAVPSRPIRFGYTKTEVCRAWGKPLRINASRSIHGPAREQWVYYSHYLYFEDGQLVSWQTRGY